MGWPPRPLLPPLVTPRTLLLWPLPPHPLPQAEQVIRASAVTPSFPGSVGVSGISGHLTTQATSLHNERSKARGRAGLYPLGGPFPRLSGASVLGPRPVLPWFSFCLSLRRRPRLLLAVCTCVIKAAKADGNGHTAALLPPPPPLHLVSVFFFCIFFLPPPPANPDFSE